MINKLSVSLPQVKCRIEVLPCFPDIRSSNERPYQQVLCYVSVDGKNLYHISVLRVRAMQKPLGTQINCMDLM